MASDPTLPSDPKAGSAADASAPALTALVKARPATPVVPLERVNPVAPTKAGSEKAKPVAKAKSAAKTNAAPSKAVAPVKASPKSTTADKDAVSALRGMAEQSLEQARATFARSQDASLSLARGFEASGQVVQSGLKEMQARVADALEAQAHATFGFFRAVTQVRTLSDMIDLQASQMRKQFERGFDEARELSSLATAVATKASEPVRKAFNHALDAQRPGH